MNLQAYTCISRLYNIAFEFEYWYIYYYYIVIVILLLSILFTRCLKKGSSFLIEMAITPLKSLKNWKVAVFWKLKHECYMWRDSATNLRELQAPILRIVFELKKNLHNVNWNLWDHVTKVRPSWRISGSLVPDGVGPRSGWSALTSFVVS